MKQVSEKFAKLQEALSDNLEALRALDDISIHQEVLERRLAKVNDHAIYGASLANSLHDLNGTCGLFMNFGSNFISNNESISVVHRNFYNDIVKRLQGILNHNLGHSVTKCGTNKKKLSIKETLDKVVKMYRWVLEREKIEIVYEHVKDFEIEADLGMINVFIQIFDNAIGAIKGKENRTIWIKSDPTRKSVTIDNSGDRIVEKYLPYIFEPFFSTKENHQGLGLTMAKEIAERNGATINHVLNSSNQSGFEVVFADTQAK